MWVVAFFRKNTKGMAYLYYFKGADIFMSAIAKQDEISSVSLSISDPIYNPALSYLDNAEQGPFFKGLFFERKRGAESEWLDFFGFKVASPIGVAAGPLLNAKWVELGAKLGFDLLCYKTIRSHSHEGHPRPNIIFLEDKHQLNPYHLPEYILAADSPPDSLDNLSMTNSFGIPSRSPEYLKKDITRANELLLKGQALIVSVVGTWNGDSFEDYLKDFVETALMAKAYGAKIIEANFSCPNVGGECVHLHPDMASRLALKLTKSLKETPLIIKVGHFVDLQVLEKLLVAAAKAGVRGISGINTICRKVLKSNGELALDSNRPVSGVCGGIIREAALSFVRESQKINQKEKLGLVIMGCGGITRPHHFKQFLEAGAEFAMCATGMMWNPYLAWHYHQEVYEK